MSPNTELITICSAISSLDNLKNRTSSVISRAITYVLDGSRIEELEGVEKTILGTKIEKFGFPNKMQNTLLDTEIASIPVDLKHTLNKTWMVPPEAVDKWLLLFRTDLNNNVYNMGLIKATLDNLTVGVNQDKKRSVSKQGKKTITWIIENHSIK